MASNSWQDQPIKPNKQYLQEKQKQFIAKKQVHQFLKKNNVGNKVLPCFRQHVMNKNEKKQAFSKQKTKAEIYEQIKLKNRQRFGDKKAPDNNVQINANIKKLDPKKMTVSYKPKKQIQIDTTEYKLANAIASPKLQSRTQTAKDKYQKLLQIVTKQKQQLARQKQNLVKNKDFIEFKKYVQKQKTIPFLQQARTKIIKDKLKRSMKRKCHNQQENQEQSNNHNEIQYQKNKRKIPELYNSNQLNISLKDAQNKIKILKQQKQQISNHIIMQTNIFDIESNNKYSIQQIDYVPSLQMQSIKQFINLQTLYPEKNKYYRAALHVIESALVVKEEKYKIKNQIQMTIQQQGHTIRNEIQKTIQQQGQNYPKQIKQLNYKRKYEGESRITKFNNGWLEIWNPGNQRLMMNQNLNYKVIWLKNGDIKQQWTNKKLLLYYCKEKQLVHITLNNKEPIYFFTKLHQLQKYNLTGNSQHLTKTVMFKSGRIDIFNVNQNERSLFSL